MPERKLRVVSWGAGDSRDGSYLTLYFNRPLSSIEQEGIVAVVKERLSDGK